MVKIRLMRVGKRKQPSFRVVVADSRSPRDGRIIESIGHYHPRQDPSVINIDNERALHWLQRGAQPSDSVRQLLKISGAWTEFTGEAAIPRLDPATTDAETPAAVVKPPRKKATPAASVTVAESVTEGDESPEAPAEVPEAADQQGAAPDAEPAESE